MAAYTTGTAAGAGAGDAFFQALRTHAGSNGWTEHDVISNSSGVRDIVYRGSALDATAGNRPFVRITQNSTTQFQFRCYTDWDTTTHAGMNLAGGTSFAVLTVQDATMTYFLRVNGYAMSGCVKYGANYNKFYVGFVRRGLPTVKAGITKTSATITAGATSVNVASDMTTGMQVGQKVMIINYAHASANANASHAEVVTLSSVGASSLGFSAAAQNYDSGALIGQNPLPVLVGNTGTSFQPTGSLYSPLHVDGSYGSAGAQVSALDYVTLGAPEANVDPDDGTSEHAGSIFVVTSAVAAKTGMRGYPYHWEACAHGSQALEDTMNDGTNTFIVLGIGGTWDLMLGPT